eukprot:13500928-Alexandrium_andersonii.AAC.1
MLSRLVGIVREIRGISRKALLGKVGLGPLAVGHRQIRQKMVNAWVYRYDLESLHMNVRQAQLRITASNKQHGKGGS